MSLSEWELVRRCKVGDRSAQKALYERTAPLIYGMLRRLLGNEHDALDAAQETYFRAFQRIDQFDGNAAFSTWLYRIAYHEALQSLKANTRRTKRIELIEQRNGALASANGLCGTNAASAESDEARDELLAALSALPPDERAILVLRYHENLDYGRLADVLGCAPGTVASRLNRARARLRELLDRRSRNTEETPGRVHLNPEATLRLRGA